MTYADLAENDPEKLDAFWMPFSANRQFKAAPRLLTGAKGMHYTSVDRRQILDATAGLWCCNAGHGREQIIEAVRYQIEQLDYAPSFQMGHPLPFALAERLTDFANVKDIDDGFTPAKKQLDFSLSE